MAHILESSSKQNISIYNNNVLSRRDGGIIFVRSRERLNESLCCLMMRKGRNKRSIQTCLYIQKLEHDGITTKRG